MSLLSRREAISAIASSALMTNQVMGSLMKSEKERLTVPLPRQKNWQDCEVGAIFHFDMPLFAPSGRTHQNSIHQTWDPQIYNPQQLDTDQWIEAAVAMGARYAIVTATHFNGFLQWQSDLYPYGVKQASWRGGKGDLVHDFIRSCHHAGIQPGIYMSCFRNAWWKVDRYRVNYGKGGPRQAEFARTCEKMFEELCMRYGPLIQIWFDAGNISPEEGGPDLLPIADQFQPDMVFYHSPQRREHRWIGNEEGHAGYPCWATMPDLETAEKMHKGQGRDWRRMLAHGIPNGQLWSPGMVDTVLRDHHWFWYANTEHTIQPLERLVKFYYESVGRNCNLVLGLTPDPTGLLPTPDCQRCAEFGAEIRRRFDHPIAKTQGTGRQITIELLPTQPVDQIVVMEEISHGERVRAYRVEGQRLGQPWQLLREGISIGHKRIQQFPAVELSAIRLVVTESVAEPLIREFAVCRVG